MNRNKEEREDVAPASKSSTLSMTASPTPEPLNTNSRSALRIDATFSGSLVGLSNVMSRDFCRLSTVGQIGRWFQLVDEVLSQIAAANELRRDIELLIHLREVEDQSELSIERDQ